jgi:hypothetical protein
MRCEMLELILILGIFLVALILTVAAGVTAGNILIKVFEKDDDEELEKPSN